MLHEYDAQMWIGAQEDYRRAHELELFRPGHVGIDPYDHISDLKEKLLITAQCEGWLRGAMLTGVRGSHREENRAIWFTTIVHPEDSVGTEMNLGDRLALVFWCQDMQRKKLLWIGTVPHQDVHCGLQNLGTDLRRP